MSDDFGHKLLAVIEGRGQSALQPLASVIREALGMEEKKPYITPPIPQSTVQPEFPQVRVKYDASGNELARRSIDSVGEFEQILREQPEIVTWLPLR